MLGYVYTCLHKYSLHALKTFNQNEHEMKSQQNTFPSVFPYLKLDSVSSTDVHNFIFV